MGTTDPRDMNSQTMGQLDFYIDVIDDSLQSGHGNTTISLPLGNGGDKMTAQYAFVGYEQPIGVSDYQLTKLFPTTFAPLASIEGS